MDPRDGTGLGPECGRNRQRRKPSKSLSHFLGGAPPDHTIHRDVEKKGGALARDGRKGWRGLIHI